MKLSAPRPTTFWIAVALGILSLIFKVVPFLWQLGLSGWLALMAFLILAAGNVLGGAAQTR